MAIRDWTGRAVMNAFKHFVFSFIRCQEVKTFILQITILTICIGFPLASFAQTDPEDGYTNDQCMECHEEMAEDHAASAHSDIQCLACHPQAADEAHEESPPPPVDCRQCHAPHDEKVAHDAHTRVTCKACHQQDGIAAADPGSGRVVFSGETLVGRNLSPHQMVARQGDTRCSSCHFKDNALGASAMVLPPKSILCMPCHAATISIGDRTTIFALLIFTLGMGGLVVVWFSGSHTWRSGHKVQGGVSYLVAGLVEDVLFIKKLYRLSPARWVIHALIYYSILIRLAFGMVALVLSLLLPDTDLTRAILDKNHPARALFFDLTGLMIIAGVCAALFRPEADRRSVSELPAPGRGMTTLLGLIVLVGFILEGLRIAMTGWPVGAQYAVIGYGISLLVKGMTGITTIYGYVWYGHAVLTGAFVAMLPFTRMMHMLTVPVVLMVAARSRVQT
jgi:hypothetical protein